MLPIIVEYAKNDGQVEGVVRHIVGGGLSILQYADNAILL
jgi:hypothetical protein